MKSEILLTLIKEVVKNEVKQQVKEEVAKLIKSGAVTINKERKSAPSLMDLTEVNSTASTKKQTIVPTQKRPTREFSKDPMINETLNMTQPFTAEQRTQGGASEIGTTSILDAIQPEKYEEDGWNTMDYRSSNVTPQIQSQIESSGNPALDSLNKALSRDYTSLAKVFSKQEKDKGLR
jgi:hypothetical protein